MLNLFCRCLHPLRSGTGVASRMAGAAVLVAGCWLACGEKQAEAAPWSIHAREENQQDRIANGIRSGALTPGETVYLERQQGRIERLERSFRADGHLSRCEREVLQHRLNHASQSIYREKHDRQRR